jgi:hypothetical protein
MHTRAPSLSPLSSLASLPPLPHSVLTASLPRMLAMITADVTPRKHARARICDQNDTHFASVRAACATNPEISTNVRFKIVPTFAELSVKVRASV